MTKRCARCNEVLPADLEFFGRSGHTEDGLHKWCRFCVSQYNRWRREGYRFEPLPPTIPGRSNSGWDNVYRGIAAMYFWKAEQAVIKRATHWRILD